MDIEFTIFCEAIETNEGKLGRLQHLVRLMHTCKLLLCISFVSHEINE